MELKQKRVTPLNPLDSLGLIEAHSWVEAVMRRTPARIQILAPRFRQLNRRLLECSTLTRRAQEWKPWTAMANDRSERVDDGLDVSSDTSIIDLVLESRADGVEAHTIQPRKTAMLAAASVVSYPWSHVALHPIDNVFQRRSWCEQFLHALFFQFVDVFGRDDATTKHGDVAGPACGECVNHCGKV